MLSLVWLGVVGKTPLPSLAQIVYKESQVRCMSIWRNTSDTPKPEVPWTTTDRIHLKGLKFHGYHGVLPEVSMLSCFAVLVKLGLMEHSEQENLLGQKFVVDATLFVDLSEPGKTDNVHDTVSYADVYR